jgi:HD-GYP domain-containing protein (c-di-GMP phosphodiesterase class II)
MESSRQPITTQSGLDPALYATAADQAPHYVQAVLRVASRSEVLVNEDIYSASGLKLLSRGARIDARQWETLSSHKLLKPLDQTLSASDCIDHVSLLRDIDKVIAANSLLSAMLDRTGNPRGWKPVLGGLCLPQALAFRLTVMREEAAQLYLHSLRVTIGAYCIATRLRFDAQQLGELMLAALCHDIGEMHTDPSILAPGTALQGVERQCIHVHPVTGYVILQHLNAVSHGVMLAVLQHHERLNGSGYPYREQGERIGMPARVIAIAETLDAVARHLDPARIPIVFRLHQGRLDAAGMDALTDLLPQGGHRQDGMGRSIEVERRLQRICTVLQAWPGLHDDIRRTAPDEAYRFVGERMLQLQSLARQCGLTPERLDMPGPDEDDAVILGDLHTTLDEMGRLFDGLAFEIERCVPAGEPYGTLSAKIISLLRQ